jgi:hypothetical protein
MIAWVRLEGDIETSELFEYLALAFGKDKAFKADVRKLDCVGQPAFGWRRFAHNSDSERQACRLLELAARASREPFCSNGYSKTEILLNRETQLSPDTVGPPFTVFRLSTMGNSWMAGADLCKGNTHLTIGN